MNIYKTSKDLEDLKGFIQAIEDKIYSKDYTIIILGKSGPTGKTYLTNKCITNGYHAVDITEKLLGNHVRISGDDENHYNIDEINRLITVVLNKPLDRYEE